MTFETNRQAAQQESTPELFEITCGSTIKRYTSYTSNITFNTFTWKAVSIKRSGLSYDREFGAITMQLRCILDDTFQKYVANQPILSLSTGYLRQTRHNTLLSSKVVSCRSPSKAIRSTLSARLRVSISASESRVCYIKVSATTISIVQGAD
jgi:hypothetical protein